MPKPSSNLRVSPVYGRMVDDLRHEIMTGKLSVGDRVAGDHALKDQYAISINSVRRGIETLVEAGLLERKQGSGTFVTDHPSLPRVGAGAAAVSSVRDTIAIVSHVQPITYHPYYSERHAGLRAGLSRHGWKLWEPPVTQRASGTRLDFAPPPYGLNPERLWEEVARHPEFAGMMLGTMYVPDVPDWEPPFAVVTADETTRFPHAIYRWRDEYARCFQHLLERGSTRIWVLGTVDDAVMRGAATDAARVLGVPEPELLLHRMSDSVSTLSETVQRSFALARRDFTPQAGIDGVLVTSEFEAQGVVDALQGLGHLTPATLPFVAITNVTDRLQTPWGITRLVVDGHAHGEVLAELLDDHIVRPAQAPRQIRLSGRLISHY